VVVGKKYFIRYNNKISDKAFIGCDEKGMEDSIEGVARVAANGICSGGLGQLLGCAVVSGYGCGASAIERLGRDGEDWSVARYALGPSDTEQRAACAP
jgi:hypothetical protein